MRITSKKLWILAAAVVLCIVAIFVISYAGVETPEEEIQASYYYTAYTDVSDLFAIEITNASGDVVVASVDGKYVAYGDYELTADQTNAKFFFTLACQLPLEKKIDGVSAQDPQYGLTEPAAEVLVYDVKDNAKMFDIGNATPDGSGYYSCLYGDTTVYVMSADYAEYFFEDVTGLYDLSLYPSFADEKAADLDSVTVSRNGRVQYTLKLASCSEDGSTVYFEMEEPYYMLLSAEQSEKEILSPLRQLSGIAVADITPEEFEKQWLNGIKISTEICCTDSVKYTVRLLDADENGISYAYVNGFPYVYEVSSALLAFTEYSPAELVGSNLFNLNASAVTELKLDSVTYSGADLSGTETGKSVLTALNHISVQDNYSGQTCSEEILSIALSTKVTDTKLNLKFYRSDNNKYVVSINGVNAFICGITAVDELLRYSIP